MKQLQDGIKVDMKNMNEHVNNDLRKAIRVIGDQLHSIATKRTEEMSRLNDALHKVQIELVAKKELREKDSQHWEVKYNTLAQEKEDLAKKMDEVRLFLEFRWFWRSGLRGHVLICNYVNECSRWSKSHIHQCHSQ